MSLQDAATCLDELSIGLTPDPRRLRVGLQALIQLRDPSHRRSARLNPYLREAAHETLLVAADREVVLSEQEVGRVKTLSQALRFAAHEVDCAPGHGAGVFLSGA